MKKQSFKNYVIVSCGTFAPELNYLKKSSFLDADKIFYTKHTGGAIFLDSVEFWEKYSIDHPEKILEFSD